jgi:hypothetical protein
MVKLTGFLNKKLLIFFMNETIIYNEKGIFFINKI